MNEIDRVDPFQATWYEKLGFENNPFSIRPSLQYELIGYNNILREIFYRVKSGSMLYIEGAPGTGKTSIMKHIISKFRGNKKVIYFNCNKIDEKLDIDDLLEGRYGWFGKTFKIKPRDMILLLDEVNSISAKNSEKIKYYFDEGFFKSVVFAGISYDKSNFTPSLRNRIGNRVIKLEPLTEDDAVIIIRSRIKDNQIIGNDIIKALWEKSFRNPRILLENCEDLCKFVTRNNRQKIKIQDIKEVFGE